MTRPNDDSQLTDCAEEVECLYGVDWLRFRVRNDCIRHHLTALMNDVNDEIKTQES